MDRRDRPNLVDVVWPGAFELSILLHHQSNGAIPRHDLVDQPQRSWLRGGKGNNGQREDDSPTQRKDGQFQYLITLGVSSFWLGDNLGAFNCLGALLNLWRLV